MKTQFPHAYVLNVLTNDHPGIVAAITRAVNLRGGNIDACSQTVVEGYFTLIMVISFAQPVEPDALAAEIRGEKTTGFQVVARPFLPPPPKPAAPLDRFVLTAFGQDKPGIVRRFSEYLAGKEINILDLFAHRQGADFLLIGQLEIPTNYNLAVLQADLERIAAELAFTVKLQHENIFVATNQLRFER